MKNVHVLFVSTYSHCSYFRILKLYFFYDLSLLRENRAIKAGDFKVLF